MKKNRVIVCEASEMVAEGLCAFMNDSDAFVTVCRMAGTEGLSEKITSTGADTLIINPSLLGYADRNLPIQLKKDHPGLSLAALVDSYVESGLLKPFDAVIEINDSRQKVLGRLNEISKARENTEKGEESIDLSKREIDILVSVSKGMTNKEISDTLNISINTVITHRKNITKKTGIKSVSGLTVYALLNNYIDESEIYK